jgi:hypothetical protein
MGGVAGASRRRRMGAQDMAARLPISPGMWGAVGPSPHLTRSKRIYPGNPRPRMDSSAGPTAASPRTWAPGRRGAPGIRVGRAGAGRREVRRPARAESLPTCRGIPNGSGTGCHDRRSTVLSQPARARSRSWTGRTPRPLPRAIQPARRGSSGCARHTHRISSGLCSTRCPAPADGRDHPARHRRGGSMRPSRPERRRVRRRSSLSDSTSSIGLGQRNP